MNAAELREADEHEMRVWQGYFCPNSAKGKSAIMNWPLPQAGPLYIIYRIIHTFIFILFFSPLPESLTFIKYVHTYLRPNVSPDAKPTYVKSNFSTNTGCFRHT